MSNQAPSLEAFKAQWKAPQKTSKGLDDFVARHYAFGGKLYSVQSFKAFLKDAKKSGVKDIPFYTTATLRGAVVRTMLKDEEAKALLDSPLGRLAKASFRPEEDVWNWNDLWQIRKRVEEAGYDVPTWDQREAVVIYDMLRHGAPDEVWERKDEEAREWATTGRELGWQSGAFKKWQEEQTASYRKRMKPIFARVAEEVIDMLSSGELDISESDY